MMKKIFFLVLTLTLYSSCVDQLSSEIRYTIYNHTDKQVTVSGFMSEIVLYTDGIADPIIISPQSSHTAIRMTGINATTSMRYYSLKDGLIDSVRVVFEDEKLLVYTRKDIRNGNKKAFSIISGDHIGEDQFGHYITEEDYSLAVDCGEKCF